MNRNTQRILFSLAVAGLLLVGVFLLQDAWSSAAHAATMATDYFASTGGFGNLCTEANPCQLAWALGQAVHGDTVYVAQGTYTGTGPSVITITASITLYGGWDGSTSVPPVRDPDLYPTTLDGEYERRVIFMNTSITPTIDGFIVTRGNASYASVDQGYGGAVYSEDAAPIISNNVISGSIAYSHTTEYGYGGGICVLSAD